MIKGHTRARNFLTQWPLPIAAAIVVAAGAGATASAPPADAQPPGTLCGHVQNRVGVSLPVIVLSGDPDCVTAVHVASDYVNGPRDSDGGTLQLQNVDGWQLCGRFSGIRYPLSGGSRGRPSAEGGIFGTLKPSRSGFTRW